jgi:hypothetical protein
LLAGFTIMVLSGRANYSSFCAFTWIHCFVTCARIKVNIVNHSSDVVVACFSSFGACSYRCIFYGITLRQPITDFCAQHAIICVAVVWATQLVGVVTPSVGAAHCVGTIGGALIWTVIVHRARRTSDSWLPHREIAEVARERKAEILEALAFAADVCLCRRAG